MKELSIEEKAKAYDEAKINGSRLWECGEITRENYEYIFPELAESDDEKIRKALIKLVKKAGEGYENVIDGVSIENAISWLEKRGEKKPADKVEPKFHEGDWVVHYGTENIYQVVNVIDNQYQLKYGDTYTVQNCADVDRCARLWDIIKDAKDGDVLTWDNGRYIILFEKLQDKIIAHCSYNTHSKHLGFYTTYDTQFDSNLKFVLATKKQRDQLEKAMADAGYTFDFEKKELKKIEQNPAESINDAYPETLDKAIDLYYYSYGNGNGYFENLSFEKFKDIVKTFVSDYSKQNSTWSEEDEKIINNIGAYLNCYGNYIIESDEEKAKDVYKSADWLKSLKTL